MDTKPPNIIIVTIKTAIKNTNQKVFGKSKQNGGEYPSHPITSTKTQ
jgi:hypothetical protein